MNEPQVVTPEEAQAALDDSLPHALRWRALAYTVATEHERRDAYARAAVVKALQWASTRDVYAIEARLYAIEDGAPL